MHHPAVGLGRIPSRDGTFDSFTSILGRRPASSASSHISHPFSQLNVRSRRHTTIGPDGGMAFLVQCSSAPPNELKESTNEPRSPKK